MAAVASLTQVAPISAFVRIPTSPGVPVPPVQRAAEQPPRGSSTAAVLSAAVALAACRRSCLARGLRPRLAAVATAEEVAVETETATAPVVPKAAPKAAPKKERRGFFSRHRKPLEERLLENLAEERKNSDRLRVEVELKEAANSAKVKVMSQEVERTSNRKPLLQKRLKESQERKRALDQQAATLARQHSPEEGLKWAPLIEEQNSAIRKVVEVVERMENDEVQINADIEKCKADTRQLTDNLKKAEDVCAQYFAKQTGPA